MGGSLIISHIRCGKLSSTDYVPVLSVRVAINDFILLMTIGANYVN